MEFGKLDDISNIDWNLPPDDPANSRVTAINSNARIYLGGTAWGTKDWLGKIYPKKTAPSEFLSYYSRQFNCIELNTTHYRIPERKTIDQWKGQIPPHFHFCPKLPQTISHSPGGLLDKGELLSWFGFLSQIQNNLGVSFIQFHENFSYENRVILFRFLESWPKEFKLCLEFRHKSWFADHKILPALRYYLFKKQMGLVITDVAGRRDVLHTSLSADWTMIRLIGNDLHESDSKRLQDWSQRLSQWKAQGLQNAYLMLHQPDDKFTPEFAEMAGETFHQGGHHEVPKLQLIKELDLFSHP